MTTDPTCNALQDTGDFPARCALRTGHDGPHMGGHLAVWPAGWRAVWGEKSEVPDAVGKVR